MATKSKYQDKQIEALLNDLIVTLEKHKAPVDLSLMALGNLGNMVTNILVTNVQSPQQREVLAEAFSSALKNSLKSAK
ncbi:YejL family protein [Glaesserella parasuis]|uniref:YejL family protein n=1 Tax=Glaesserella parasuis TaxID=738 RepID=UPI003B0B8E48